MHFDLSRTAASLTLRARFTRCAALAIFSTTLFAVAANAVVVRGRVTDALGAPVGGAQVRLFENGQSVALAYADADGSYEIRFANAGRFALLGTGTSYLPSLSTDFYGGATDVLEKDVVLAANTVRQDVTVSATGIPTPLPQLTAPLSVLAPELFTTRLGVIDEMRQTPGAFLVQTGQTGGVTSLFLRGGNSTANLVLIDGMPAGDVGGTFDYGTVSSTAVGKMELYRGPDSAMYGTDAGASVIAIDTPRGSTTNPVLNYSGDAGNLHTWRNEVSVGGAWQRLDYYGAISRLDTSNALPNDQFHATTSAVNLGYGINGNTLLRATIRNADSVTGLPGAYDFFNVTNVGRQGDQDLYAGLTLENTYKGNWHNLVRYGIARKREQAQKFGNQGNPVTFIYSCGTGCTYPYTEYFGNVVTVRGANGYKVTGQTSIYGSDSDQDSNRDQLYYESDYTVSPHFIGLFGFRYDNERGSFNDAEFGEAEKVDRRNFEYNLQFQGEFFNRLFYSAGGALEKNHLYGIAGTPRLGLSYVPVRSSNSVFHGTRFRANAATGVQEPTLALEYNSLYTQLLAAGDTSDIAKYHVGPQSAERSRTYDIGVDQNVLGEKLVLKAGYFHNVFDRQLEAVGADALAQYFGFTFAPNYVYDAYLNSLAFRAQGEELELQWQPKNHLMVRGGYTHLDGKVLQSFASDAVDANQGFPTTNPNFPNIAIGAESPLVGGRPFRRAPNTGFVDMQYTRPKFTLAIKGSLASRSDDSTYLDYSDLNGGNTLLLPNRDLDFGYVKLDVGATYALKHNFTFFTQLDNLLNDQHIGPIGYPGLPFTFRTGLKFKLGGD